MENEIKELNNEVTNANVTITDKTEEPKKKNFFVRAKDKIVEYHDKEQHPVAARVIKVGEVIGGGILCLFCTKGYIDSQVEKGRIPVDLCENSYYTGDEDEPTTYEGTCEEQSETESEEPEKEAKEETEEKIAE